MPRDDCAKADEPCLHLSLEHSHVAYGNEEVLCQVKCHDCGFSVESQSLMACMQRLNLSRASNEMARFNQQIKIMLKMGFEMEELCGRFRPETAMFDCTPLRICVFECVPNSAVPDSDPMKTSFLPKQR